MKVGFNEPDKNFLEDPFQFLLEILFQPPNIFLVPLTFPQIIGNLLIRKMLAPQFPHQEVHKLANPSSILPLDKLMS